MKYLFFLLICAWQEAQSQDMRYYFQNFNSSEIQMPKELNSIQLSLLKGSCFRFSNKRFPKTTQIKTEGPLYDFFSSLDLVNGTILLENYPDSVFTRDLGWVAFPGFNKEASLAYFKQQCPEIYLVKRVCNSLKFESILFKLKVSTDYNYAETLYLLNYKNDYALSILKVAHDYIEDDGGIKFISSINPQGIISIHEDGLKVKKLKLLSSGHLLNLIE